VKYRQFITLQDFLDNIHPEGSGIIDYEGDHVPCIYVKESLYDNILKKSIGKKYVVEVLLNIFYDGHYVFVDVQIEFINLGIEENFLLQGNTSIDFFDSLSNSGLLAIIPKNHLNSHTSNIFLIQLPNKDRVSKAVDIIKSNLGININNERRQFKEKKGS
jgi:hypothetical protein